MPDEKKGHEELDLVDPDSLDDEAFLKEKEKLLSGAGTDDSGDEAGQSLDNKGEGDTGHDDKPPGEKAKGEGDDDGPGKQAKGDTDEGGKPKTDEKSDKEKGNGDEPKPFSLDDDVKPKAEDDKGDAKPFLKIVHGGKDQDLSEEQTRELAQKGFDYEAKTRQLAPYRRLIELINKDNKLAGFITSYIQSGGKLPEAKKSALPPETPKLKPLSEYDGEDAAERWLMDGIKTILDSKPKDDVREDTEHPVLEISPEKKRDFQQALQIRALLSINDPDNFDRVFPEMIQRLPSLTVQDQQKINEQCAGGDFRGIAKFYNYVKDNYVNGKGFVPVENDTLAKPEADKFRMKPGGGNPPKESSGNGLDDLPDAFSLSESDFRKTMAKIKGHI